MVLDSSALIAIFKQEPGYQFLEQQIDRADTIQVGAPTLVETAMVLSRLTGKDQRAFLEAYLRRIGAHVIEFTESHYVVAGDAFLHFGRGFNSKSCLNYGDCLAYAVAVLSGDSLLFVGEDFRHTDVTPA